MPHAGVTISGGAAEIEGHDREAGVEGLDVGDPERLRVRIGLAVQVGGGKET